jgi:hypothetical protein
LLVKCNDTGSLDELLPSPAPADEPGAADDAIEAAQ